ncbi:MAG: hypothetical protein JWO59_342 [Chloroflexi bacterium]|nr:hypothetical protein [Chloroflexota bacterium]
MGVAAMHIFHGTDYPTMFYGQGYMGTFEAYLGAALFRMLGESVFSLRLGLVLLFALFLTSTYLLGCLLYSRRVAFIALVFLCLGSDRVVFKQVEVTGGYAETLLFGSVAYLLASWLAITKQDSMHAPRRRWRYAAFGAWGLVAGLGLWNDFLILPFIVTSAVLLLLCCWPEMRSWAGCVLVIGLVLGAAPLVAYNLRAPADGDSLYWLSQQRLRSGITVRGLAGTALVSIPTATSGTDLCWIQPDDAWPLSPTSTSHARLCSAVHAGWTAGLAGLGMLSLVLASSSLWLACLRNRAAAISESEGRERTLLVARILLLLSAGLTLLLYLDSNAATLFPRQNARYLEGILLTMPAILAPLCGDTFPGIERRATGHRLWQGTRIAVGAIIALTLLLGTSGSINSVSRAQQTWHDQARLVALLERLDATRIYTDYWTCYSLAFQSHERIVCDVLGDNLRQGQNRYLPYVALVQRAQHAYYVFTAQSHQASILVRRRPARYLGNISGYLIYGPVTPSLMPKS